MKNLTFNFKSIVQTKARWLLTFCALLTLGVGQMWAETKPIYLEFNPLKASKGIALESICAYLGIRPEDTVAFGDSLNDLSMLRRAGIGVAVSNGWKEILPCCDDICMSNNDDGPAWWLNEHYLNSEVSP